LFQRIEDYGVIGNMRTVALVSVRGSIDWLCFPQFDSPSVFAALLDDTKGGRFAVGPADERVACKQLYWPDTNILTTRFLSENGVAEIEDFMPCGTGVREPRPEIVRHVRCVRGAIDLDVVCEPAFDYARVAPETSPVKWGALFRGAGVTLALSTHVPLSVTPRGARAA
jgi:GH15 family glucan-1,4-alpha-glucosidase